MGKTSWNGQIYRALKAIDRIGESKYAAKQAQGWKPGEAVEGIYSFGTFPRSSDGPSPTRTGWSRSILAEVL